MCLNKALNVSGIISDELINNATFKFQNNHNLKILFLFQNAKCFFGWVQLDFYGGRNFQTCPISSMSFLKSPILIYNGTITNKTIIFNFSSLVFLKYYQQNHKINYVEYSILNFKFNKPI